MTWGTNRDDLGQSWKRRLQCAFDSKRASAGLSWGDLSWDELDLSGCSLQNRLGGEGRVGRSSWGGSSSYPWGMMMVDWTQDGVVAKMQRRAWGQGRSFELKLTGIAGGLGVSKGSEQCEKGEWGRE